MTSVASVSAISSKVFLNCLDSLQTGIVLINTDGNIVYWNHWMETRSDITFSQIENRLFVEAFESLATSRLAMTIHQAIHTGMSSLISASLNKSLLPLYANDNLDRKRGRYIKQMVQVSSVADEQGKRFALLQITDMTSVLAREVQLREQSEMIQRMANIDHLTGIANRRKFDVTLQEEFKRAQRACSSIVVGIIDIDHFKLYNDHYGHILGDGCLTDVARSLQHSLRRTSDTVARYGGEEFGLILPGATFESAAKLAEEIRVRVMALRIRHEASPTDSYVTISIGLSVLTPTMTDNPDILMSSADFALYQAKHGGRNKAMIYSIKESNLHECG